MSANGGRILLKQDEQMMVVYCFIMGVKYEVVGSFVYFTYNFCIW